MIQERIIIKKVNNGFILEVKSEDRFGKTEKEVYVERNAEDLTDMLKALMMRVYDRKKDETTGEPIFLTFC